MHDQHTKDRATKLYFEIERHFGLGGLPLSLRDINKMVGRSSSASSQMYVKILEEWGLITRIPGTARTIVLAKTDYPNVFYIDKEGYLSCVTFNKKDR